MTFRHPCVAKHCLHWRPHARFCAAQRGAAPIPALRRHGAPPHERRGRRGLVPRPRRRVLCLCPRRTAGVSGRVPRVPARGQGARRLRVLRRHVRACVRVVRRGRAGRPVRRRRRGRLPHHRRGGRRGDVPLRAPRTRPPAPVPRPRRAVSLVHRTRAPAATPHTPLRNTPQHSATPPRRHRAACRSPTPPSLPPASTTRTHSSRLERLSDTFLRVMNQLF